LAKITCHYKGLNPSVTTREKVEKLASSLSYLIPAGDHTIRLSITRFSQGYEGSIATLTDEGRFFANCKNDDIFNLIKDLRKTLRLQILKERDLKRTYKKAR